jgi:hypothetical protein
MNNFRKKGNVILAIFLLIGGSFFAQTQQQASHFINISLKGVNKTQKDLMRGKVSAASDPDFRKAMKYQFIAVKLFNQNNFQEAVIYSYKARLFVEEILSPTDPIVKDKMKISDEEKIFFDPAKVGDVKMTPKILNAADSKKLDEVNFLDIEEFRKLELGVPVENQQ